MYAGGFGKAKGHLMFVEAVFVCLHWQMDGVCGQRAQLGADCVSATDTEDLKKAVQYIKKHCLSPFSTAQESESKADRFIFPR